MFTYKFVTSSLEFLFSPVFVSAVHLAQKTAITFMSPQLDSGLQGQGGALFVIVSQHPDQGRAEYIQYTLLKK